MKVTKTTMFFLGRLEIFLHIHSVIKRDGTAGGTKGWTDGGWERTWPGQDRTMDGWTVQRFSTQLNTQTHTQWREDHTGIVCVVKWVGA